MRAASLTALACLAALALIPGKAAAVPCAPPGVAGVDQYFETVPGAACNMSPAGCGEGHHDLSRSEVQRLESEGAAGRGVIRSVATYAPPIPRTPPATAPAKGENPIAALGRLMITGSSTRTGAGPPRSRSSTRAGAGPPRPLCAKSSASGTGAGPFLPIVFAVALVGAVAAVLVRRRRAQPAPA